MWLIKQFQCHMSISDKSSVIYFRCSSFPRVFAPKQDSFPMMSIKHAIHWLYPHTILLGHEGKMAVEDVLKVSACFTSFPSSTFPPLPSPSLPISSFPFLSLSLFFAHLYSAWLKSSSLLLTRHTLPAEVWVAPPLTEEAPRAWLTCLPLPAYPMASGHSEGMQGSSVAWPS